MEHLANCCNYLEESCSLINESYEEIHKQTHEKNSEFPYNVTRVFQLLPEFDVNKTRLDAIEAVDPLVRKIETKIEQLVSRLETEKANLQQAYELNLLRKSNNSQHQQYNNSSNNNNNNNNNNDTNTTNNSNHTSDSNTFNVIMTSSTPEELRILKNLKLQKEELIKQIEDLNEHYK